MLSEASYKQLRFKGQADTQIPAQRLARSAWRKWPPDGLKLVGEEHQLTEIILAGAGLTASSYRANPLRRRLSAVLRAMRTTSLDSAIARLAADPGRLQRALNSLLIGHTTAFRDAEVFSSLRTMVLPTLAESRVAPLRVWSLGCSTGEELLSVALLLLERGMHRDVRLRGSDCRPDAIEEARQRAEAVWSAVPLSFADLRSSVEKDLFRKLAVGIEWRAEDVLSCEMSGQWDVVLCRNLSIYLEPSVSKRLWERVETCLAPGGFLITGKAERPCGTRSLRRVAKCVYQAEEAEA